MPRTCFICKHPERFRIEKALSEGVPLRQVVSQFGTSTGTLRRHKAHTPSLKHVVPKVLDRAGEKNRECYVCLSDTIWHGTPFSCGSILKPTREWEAPTAVDGWAAFNAGELSGVPRLISISPGGVLPDGGQLFVYEIEGTGETFSISVQAGRGVLHRKDPRGSYTFGGLLSSEYTPRVPTADRPLNGTGEEHITSNAAYSFCRWGKCSPVPPKARTWDVLRGEFVE